VQYVNASIMTILNIEIIFNKYTFQLSHNNIVLLNKKALLFKKSDKLCENATLESCSTK